ncbi:hypothetical protein HF324_04810 [Chitinophaga oryzae]|uniref:Uncharacterized protein n=1 Tax=Chitinophaga oryzae TaxID=2725414 RepID=A0ABX6LAR5_9BACT|nr:hypothetical protein [Chitinophaga oryzae]QJB37208.1 hypothetical protein HF324_04810 [Chitinophaga oryzae]
MKFCINYTNVIEQKTLIYHIEECSFDTEPAVQEINFDIALNKLNLTATDDDNKIAQVGGFCGYNEWIKSNYQVPERKSGVLKVLDDLVSGEGSYAISKEDFPVYVNIQTGWVCIGNPEKGGDAVEFITNCVAVIDSNKNFVSLWLKPKKLPDI